MTHGPLEVQEREQAMTYFQNSHRAAAVGSRYCRRTAGANIGARDSVDDQGAGRPPGQGNPDAHSRISARRRRPRASPQCVWFHLRAGGFDCDAIKLPPSGTCPAVMRDMAKSEYPIHVHADSSFDSNVRLSLYIRLVAPKIFPSTGEFPLLLYAHHEK